MLSTRLLKNTVNSDVFGRFSSLTLQNRRKYQCFFFYKHKNRAKYSVFGRFWPKIFDQEPQQQQQQQHQQQQEEHMTPCKLGAGGPCRGAAWIHPSSRVHFPASYVSLSEWSRNSSRVLGSNMYTKSSTICNQKVFPIHPKKQVLLNIMSPGENMSQKQVKKWIHQVEHRPFKRLMLKKTWKKRLPKSSNEAGKASWWLFPQPIWNILVKLEHESWMIGVKLQQL